MKKKKLYVVTQTIVGLAPLSVDTFPIGHTENLYVAKKLIEDEFDNFLKLGYEKSRFEFTKRGFIYKSNYFVSIIEMLISKKL